MTITPVTQDRDSVTDTYFIAIKQDVTERKKAEEALLFKTALLEAETETTIDGILVVDESNRIVMANGQFGLHFGVPDELLRAGDDLAVRKYVMDNLSGRSQHFYSIFDILYNIGMRKSRDEIRFKDGKIFDRYSAPLVDSNGQHRGKNLVLSRYHRSQGCRGTHPVPGLL